MAKVLALVPDLLFGSKIQSLMAGHEVKLVTSEPEVWNAIAGSDLLVVDLASEDVDGIALVDTLKSGGEMHGVRTLGFYSHVDTETKARAEAVGFDLVVPRSRMAREGGQLAAKLLED